MPCATWLISIAFNQLTLNMLPTSTSDLATPIQTGLSGRRLAAIEADLLNNLDHLNMERQAHAFISLQRSGLLNES